MFGRMHGHFCLLRTAKAKIVKLMFGNLTISRRWKRLLQDQKSSEDHMYFFFVRISCVQILAKCNIQILYILQAHLRPLESPATDKQTKLPSFSSCLWIGFSFRSFFCITTNTFPFSPFVLHHVSLHVCLHCHWEKILNLMQKKCPGGSAI